MNENNDTDTTARRNETNDQNPNNQKKETMSSTMLLTRRLENIMIETET